MFFKWNRRLYVRENCVLMENSSGLFNTKWFNVNHAHAHTQNNKHVVCLYVCEEKFNELHTYTHGYWDDWRLICSTSFNTRQVKLYEYDFETFLSHSLYLLHVQIHAPTNTRTPKHIPFFLEKRNRYDMIWYDIRKVAMTNMWRCELIKNTFYVVFWLCLPTTKKHIYAYA